MPTVEEISEIVERMAISFNGSSFANEYAKRDTVRKIVRALYELKPEDLDTLRAELGNYST